MQARLKLAQTETNSKSALCAFLWPFCSGGESHDGLCAELFFIGRDPKDTVIFDSTLFLENFKLTG